MTLSDAQKESVKRSINGLFYTVSAKFLGRFYRGPSIYFDLVRQSEPEFTLEGIYRYTAALQFGPGMNTDDKKLESMAEIAHNYIEAKRLQTVSRVIKAIETSQDPQEAMKIIEDEIDSLQTYLESLIMTESRNVQAFAEQEGISQVAASVGDDDPTVIMTGRYDNKTCKYCRIMYHDPVNPEKPIPYKLKDLSSGYFKPKEWDQVSGHIPPLHPRCRHMLSYVAKGYGYPKGRVPEFIGLDYDYYIDYHSSYNKSESLAFLSHEDDHCSHD
jgi:hypothetical protein